MAFDYDQLASLRRTDALCRYNDRAALHYALSVGMGRNPLDRNELSFVTELFEEKVMPSLATVVGPFYFKVDVKGLAVSGGVHGEQYLTLHRPMPRAAELLVDSSILDVIDKGAGKHALVYGEQRARLKETGEPVFDLRYVLVCFGAGGFGGHKEGGPVAHRMPDRPPDAVCVLPTTENQALLYALNGDRVPLHRDPVLAREQGYERPIMHGLCSYGIACHAVLKTMCDYDHTRIRGFDVRFSAPAYPGETYLMEMWKDANIVSFRGRLKERDVIVMNNGKCTLA